LGFRPIPETKAATLSPRRVPGIIQEALQLAFTAFFELRTEQFIR
jgi:hypothetical protein